MASFLPGSHRLSCSWLKFGSQDTFSQFPRLVSLDVFCGVAGNGVEGGDPNGAPPGTSPPVPGRCCCSRPQAATVRGLYIRTPRRGFFLSQSEDSYPLSSPVSVVTCHLRAWPPVAPGLGQSRGQSRGSRIGVDQGESVAGGVRTAGAQRAAAGRSRGGRSLGQWPGKGRRDGGESPAAPLPAEPRTATAPAQREGGLCLPSTPGRASGPSPLTPADTDVRGVTRMSMELSGVRIGM